MNSSAYAAKKQNTINTESISVMNLLLVEDHSLTLNRLQRLFDDSYQYTVVAAVHSAEEAIFHLQRRHVDLIILDLGLPGISGCEAIKALKNIQPNAEILIFTVMDEDEQVFAALKAGASGYILKDAKSSEILDAIEELKGGGAPMSYPIARKVLREFQTKPQVASSPVNFTPLSERETEILELLYQGNYPKGIAESLCISLHTVNTHIKNIYKKLHVNSCTQAIYEACRQQVIRR